MKNWFKGQDHIDDAVDFQTSKSLYEVKSCNIFNTYYNMNHKRDFKKAPHKSCKSYQSGRFQIIVANHIKLKLLADQENKIAKYVFVICIENQIIWKVVEWKDLLVNNTNNYVYKRIVDVFGNFEN